MIPTLAKALRVEPAAFIAFAGAGGKTTALFQLARELPPPVIVTATTHLGTWQVGLADGHVTAGSSAPLEELEHGLSGVILVTGETDGDRTKPVPREALDWLHQFCGYHSIPLLMEADGSRQKPLKGWAEYEPPIPDFATSVVQVAGLGGIGKPLNEEHVHRPEIFSSLSGLKIGETISPEALTRVLLHGSGGLKNFPKDVRKVVLLNQADTAVLQSIAHGMSQALLSGFDAVAVSSLERREIFAVHEKVAGIILGAGESSRFGQPKQLLDWKGQPFIRAVAKTALEAGLSPIVVVTGANAEQVETAIHDLPVKIVRNEEWREGQASSIRAGVRAVDKRIGASVFLLSDQPQVTTSILRALVEKHAEGLYPIVAPLVMDQRANPVLFDRAAFRDLLTIEGDVGGRAIFHKARVEYLPWHDDRLLLDVDTPEMYQRLIADDSL
ncbi:MAG: putative selenium-dependent hydroxylase accessory protein YqeC [Anaerolineales bacterium]|nr:MAG: putative selenium-dependent hydroxylase accessory protein YqeC [Anaerolineales bacterium]